MAPDEAVLGDAWEEAGLFDGMQVEHPFEETLKAEAETTVRHATVLPLVGVPVVVFGV